MKIFYLLFLTVLCLSFSASYYTDLKSATSNNIDSNIIIHKHDGKTEEWLADKFSNDEESTIRYAIDNDNQNLYLALEILDQNEQIKMMRMGMNIYFDLKGKKKVSMGIEFPLKSEQSIGFESTGNPGQQSNTQRGKPDLQNARIMFGYNLLGLKMFGFTQAEPFRQDLDNKGSVQIAYSWDSTNMMQIEYLVPFKIFGEISSSNQKSISIGFKVNGMEMSNNNAPVITSTSIQSRPAGNLPPNNSNPFSVSRNSSSNQSGMDKLMKEQLFWTKYTLNIKKE